MRSPTDGAKAYLSVSEFAETLGLCEKTIRRAIDDGELHSHKIRGRIRIYWEDAHAFVAARRR